MIRYLLSLLLCVSLSSTAQSGNVIIKEFGPDSLINSGKAVIQLPSGSIFLCGYATDSLNRWTIHFNKLDRNGDLLFTRYLGGPTGQALMERMELHPDGNFVLSATSIDSTGPNEPMLIKVDTNGNVIWQRRYGNGFANGSMLGLSIRNDGQILASGFTTDIGAPYIGFLSVRTDADGNVLHSNVFSNPSTILTSDQTNFLADGNIVISGDIRIGPTEFSAHVIKADTNGNVLWESTVANRLNGGCKNELIDSNNDLVLIGESATDSSNNFDIQISKFDLQTGAIKWTKFIPGSDESDAGFSIIETPDHNYLIAGYGHDTSLNAKRVVMLLTDSSGNELRKNYYGNGTANIGFDITPSIDGNYLIAGSNYSNGKSILILDNPANWSSVAELNSGRFTVYPTVLRSGEVLHWTTPVEAFTVTDIHGRIVLNYDSADKTDQLRTDGLAGGTYFLITYMNGQRFASRFIVQ